jgi:predicted short-subunit dehydrogenase-like oxidoreductase (DUF2520 family)
MEERVAFIGAGNVAWHLSHALDAAGYTISAIASRKRSSAKRLASCFSAAYAKDPADIISNETHIFITTPDEAIAAVARHLCKKELLSRNQLVVHTSGLHGTALIKCVRKKGALPLSMHPALSFSSSSYVKDEFQGVWFALQGSKEALQKGKRMVRAVNGKQVVLTPDKKPLYHLALVFASNFFVGIEDISIELLKECGVTRTAAKKLILPLVYTTLNNIQTQGTRKALTGPVERGDTAILKKHLATLSKHKRAYKKTYLELSKHLTRMVNKKGELPKGTIRELKQLFKG